MGERTRLRVGTNEGVKTVRVYSANPKTADGFNTFIFRRDIARTLNKLAWSPVIDGSRNPVPEGIVIGDKSVRYSADDKRRVVAKFKVDSEVTSLHGQSRIGESTFEQVYDSRFRLILQGVAEADVVADIVVVGSRSRTEEIRDV